MPCNDHKVWYIVSESRDRIESNEYEEAPIHYKTPEAAGESIVAGEHGEVGVRYVLAVDVSLVSVWERSWTPAREDV